MITMVQDALVHLSAFVFVLSLVVFVHEFGHFQVARWCGVAIDTFSIGFGRKLIGWRDRQGVEWKIGALPLGGYVKFIGDADAASMQAEGGAVDGAAQAEARRRGLYHAQNPWVRIAVALAGPMANFIFAIVAFGLLLMVFGRDDTPVAQLSPRIDQVQADSAASRAGLKPGDMVVSINDAPIRSFGELQKAISGSANKQFSLVVKREGDLVALSATPTSRKVMDEAGVERTQGMLGIGRTTLPGERQIKKFGPIEAIGGGAKQTWRIITSTGAYVANVFSGRASPEHIAGPLGIMDLSGEVAKVSGQGQTILDKAGNLAAGLIGWAATLSVAVGIVNLLPVPILDGGHVLFCLVEALRGKPLDSRTQLIGFRAGLALLGSLFLFATWNDLQRLNVLEFLSGILS
ncbi:MAG: RIP metalloprotease [Hyphomonadaceae bacterium]